MRSNAGMATRRRDVDLRFVLVSAPIRTLAWFGSASYPNNLQRWLTERRIAINVSKSSAIIFPRTGPRYIQPRSVPLFGEPIKLVDTTLYLGVALDKRLIWTPHIDQFSRRSDQSVGLLGPLLNKKSDLSIRNGVLLYKQLIRQMMDYACPAGSSAARTHFRRLQLLKSKCLRLVTRAAWYLSNRQIHEDLGVPLFADHRALTASFDSKLADAGNPLVRQLGRYLLWPRIGSVARSANRRRRVPTDQSRQPLVDGQVDQTNRAQR